jgi:hypothetical protein
MANWDLGIVNWHHVVLLKSASNIATYVDGNSFGQGGVSGTLSFSNLRIGSTSFDGQVDEIRISASTRSADWLAFEYCNMMGTCTSYASEENKTGSMSTDYTVILTARDIANNTDQDTQTVHLDPVNYGCAALCPGGQCCEAACYTPTACTTSQCASHTPSGGPTQTYRQTRLAPCLDNCHCQSWSPFLTCLESFQNCSVECHIGTGCKTADNECYCDTGYEPDSANPGSCKLKEFNFNTINTLGDDQLSLVWAVQEAATQYRIERSCGGDPTCTSRTYTEEISICNTSVCSSIDQDLAPGTTYRYDIFAIVGSTDGIYNSRVLPLPVCSGTNSPSCPQFGTTGSVVGNFTIASVCGQLTLSWDKINIAGYTYKIYKGNAANPTVLFREIADADCGGTRCTISDKEIVPKATYFYKIVTIDEDGEPSSKEATGSGSSYCYEAPGWEER